MVTDGPSAQYYAGRAQRVREIAKGIRGKGLKEEYEAIADQYERLARLAETGAPRS